MKKILSLLMVFLMAFSLFACGGETTQESKENESETEETKELTPLEQAKLEYDTVPNRVQLNNYDDKIAEYEAKGIEKGKIIFYGSSGFTRWSSQYGVTPVEQQILAKDGSQICINHGFGGSTAHELVHYYDRMVKAYEPKALVVSTCINDWGKHYTGTEQLACIKYLCEQAISDFPDIHIYVTDVRPMAKPISATSKMEKQQLNVAIKKYCETRPDQLYFVALSQETFYYNNPESATTNTYEDINVSLYVEDQVHYTQEGYNLFAEVWKRHLDREL